MIKKRLVKKTTAIAITGALTIAMTASVLAAPGGPGGNGGPGGGPGGEGPSQEMQQGAAINEVDPGRGDIGHEGGPASGESPYVDRNAAERSEGAIPQQGPGGGGDFNPGGSQGDGGPTGQMPEMPSGEAPTGERPEMPSGEAPTGERPEMPSGEAPTGERPEMPSGEAPTGEKPNMKGGNVGRGEQNRPEMGMKGINTDSIKTSIETLEDEDTKTALETLLSEYESAKTALDTAIKEKSDDVDTLREAEKTAMEALNTALKEAGIDTRPERPDNKGMKGFNTDEIKTSIEAVEDEDTKAALETLLSDYEAAKTALDTAIKEGSDDVDTLREAEKTAMEALNTALKEAGIDTRSERPDNKGMKGINTDDIRTSIEALEDGDTKTNLETLLSEYESAKAALDTAIEEGSDDIDTLREAEMKAMEALRTALEEAGIDARPQLPEGEGNGDTGMGQRPEKPADDDGSDMPSEKPAMQQSGAANNGTNAAEDNIFTRFGNWFMSLFLR